MEVYLTESDRRDIRAHCKAAAKASRLPRKARDLLQAKLELETTAALKQQRTQEVRDKLGLISTPHDVAHAAKGLHL